MSPSDFRPELEALAAGLDRETRRVDEFEASTTGRLDNLDGRVCGLAEMFDSLVNDLHIAPRSFLMVSDQTVARAMLADLAKWLKLVYLEYQDAYLPACWAYHSEVVEELWWLSRSWFVAYSGRGWADKVGTWSDKARPHVVERIRKWTSSCSIDEHRQPTPAPTVPLAGHLDAIADAWVSTGLPPVPTEEQVREARAHEDRKFDRARAVIRLEDVRAGQGR